MSTTLPAVDLLKPRRGKKGPHLGLAGATRSRCGITRPPTAAPAPLDHPPQSRRAPPLPRSTPRRRTALRQRDPNGEWPWPLGPGPAPDSSHGGKEGGKGEGSRRRHRGCSRSLAGAKRSRLRFKIVLYRMFSTIYSVNLDKVRSISLPINQ